LSDDDPFVGMRIAFVSGPDGEAIEFAQSQQL
jgi:hypothetical protein